MSRQTMVSVPGTVDDRPVTFTEIEFEITHEEIRSELPEWDPNWRYVDRAGHGHFGSSEAGKPLPTLVWTITRTYWCEDCGDEHDEGEWRCPHCEEAITPGTRPFTPRLIETGRTFTARLPMDDLAPSGDATEHIVNVGGTRYRCRQVSVEGDSRRGWTITLVGSGMPV